MKTLIQVLMERDGLTKYQAIQQVKEAYDLFQDYLETGELGLADDICQDEFGLEPDFIFDLIAIGSANDGLV